MEWEFQLNLILFKDYNTVVLYFLPSWLIASRRVAPQDREALPHQVSSASEVCTWLFFLAACDHLSPVSFLIV